MGLFSKDSFKITDGACTVTFEKSGEVTEKRVNKIFSSSKVQACRAVNVKFGEKVTSIGDRAFFACSQLAGIEIPRSVTSIGFWAFGHCARLESIEIPGNVISIGKNAFEHCQRLKNIRIHEGVTSIGDYAFSYCKGLTNIEFPSSIASIGLKVFDNCPKLASITVENGNTSYKSIDGNLYSRNGDKLIKYAIGKTDSTFEIPAGVTDIGIYAFENCVNLTSVKIHDEVVKIESWAFSGCENLTIYCEVEAIPKGWGLGWNLSNRPVVLKDKIHKRVLDGEDSEDSYKIENGICKVYFSEYGELTKERVNKILELPDVALCKEINVITSQNVTGIDFWAFHRIDNLTSVELSSSVTNICTPPFSYCKALESIRVDDDNAEYKSVDGSLYTKDGRVLVQYAAGKNDTSFVIPDGVESIGDYAFCQCKGLTSIEIPSTVTIIGEGAFAECTGITEIKLPRGITAISDSMLHTCTSLTSVEIPSTVTIIGKDAFSRCLSLSKIRLPEGVTSIGSQAFYLCGSLPSIEIPSGTENIGKHAFFECSSLKIYTEEESKPSGWDDSWNSSKRPVFWDARKVLLSKLVTAINPQAGAQGLANALKNINISYGQAWLNSLIQNL